MALPYNTRSRDPIPSGTIRPKFDISTSLETCFNSCSPRSCFTFNLNGACLDRNSSINNCAAVPIGGWLVMNDDKNVCGTIKSHSTYQYPNRFLNGPERLTDDMATNCAGGSNLGPVQFLKYDNGNKECKISGPVPVTHRSAYDRVQGGTQFPVLCQMGDYIETVSDCKRQCADNDIANLDPAENNYCNFAKERLCGKLKGEPLKKNADGTEAILSDRDWIREPICSTFCGGPGAITSKPCYENKHKYCTDPRGWNQVSEKRAKFITSSILPDFPIYSNADESLTSSLTDTQLIINRNPVSVGDRILVKDQVIKQQNGIYRVVNDGSSPDSEWKIVRASDFNQASTPLSAAGFIVIIEQDSSVWGLETDILQLNPLQNEVIWIPSSQYDPNKAPYCKVFWRDQLIKKENNEADIDSDIVKDILKRLFPLTN